MEPRIRFFGALPLALLAGGVAGASTSAEDEFEAHLVPFFREHCTKCHGETKQKGDLRVDDLAGALGKGEDLERWEGVFEMLASGEMPPEEAKQPSQAERAKVVGWIKGQLAAAGHGSDWDRKLRYPEYGNLDLNLKKNGVPQTGAIAELL